MARGLSCPKVVLLWSDSGCEKEMVSLVRYIRKNLGLAITELWNDTADPDGGDDWGEPILDSHKHYLQMIENSIAVVLFLSHGRSKLLREFITASIISSPPTIITLYDASDEDVEMFHPLLMCDCYHRIKCGRKEASDITKMIKSLIQCSKESVRFSPNSCELRAAIFGNLQRYYTPCLEACSYSRRIAGTFHVVKPLIQRALLNICISAYVKTCGDKHPPQDDFHVSAVNLFKSKPSCKRLVNFLQQNELTSGIGDRHLCQLQLITDQLSAGIELLLEVEAVTDVCKSFASMSSLDSSLINNGVAVELLPPSSDYSSDVKRILESLQRALAKEDELDSLPDISILIERALTDNWLNLSLESFLRLCSLNGLLDLVQQQQQQQQHKQEKQWQFLDKISTQLRSYCVGELFLCLREIILCSQERKLCK